MAEYIDREATIEFIRLNYCKDCNSYNGVGCRACSFDDAMLAIEDVPTADVVEVVRCKDCIHYEANGFVYEEGCGRCDHPRQQWEVECYDQWVETRPNDFCSYGERRETDDKG